MTDGTGMETVRVEQVRSRRDLGRFIELPFELYRHDSCWVPPLRYERRRFLTAKHNPFFDHADVALWLARRCGKVVGRISSQIDHLHNQVYDERLAMFGFFECERSPETAVALLNAAAGWSRQRGAKALRGPLSFSTNHESGLLVEGFDQPPAVGMPYNPEWYQEHLEQWGLAKEMDLLSARAEVGKGFRGMCDIPEDLLKVAKGLKDFAGVTIRHGKNLVFQEMGRTRRTGMLLTRHLIIEMERTIWQRQFDIGRVIRVFLGQDVDLHAVLEFEDVDGFMEAFIRFRGHASSPPLSTYTVSKAN